MYCLYFSYFSDFGHFSHFWHFLTRGSQMTTEDDDEGSNALENRGTYISNGVD